jgi:hypothetical protein
LALDDQQLTKLLVHLPLSLLLLVLYLQGTLLMCGNEHPCVLMLLHYLQKHLHDLLCRQKLGLQLVCSF